jgi:thioredoxin-related protein
MSEENYKYIVMISHSLGDADQEGEEYDNIDDAVNDAKHIQKENKDAIVTVEVVYE